MLDFFTEHLWISYPRGLFIEPAAVRMHGDMFVFQGSEWTSYPQGFVRQPTVAPMHGGTIVFLRITNGFHSRGDSLDSQLLCVWNLNSWIGPWLETYPEAYAAVLVSVVVASAARRTPVAHTYTQLHTHSPAHTYTYAYTYTYTYT